MFQNLKVMSLEDCTVFLSSKIAIFFKVELLMSLTIHDLKILFYCSVFIRLLFLLLMLQIFGVQEYVLTDFLFQGIKRKLCGNKLFNAVIVKDLIVTEMM